MKEGKINAEALPYCEHLFEENGNDPQTQVVEDMVVFWAIPLGGNPSLDVAVLARTFQLLSKLNTNICFYFLGARVIHFHACLICWDA